MQCNKMHVQTIYIKSAGKSRLKLTEVNIIKKNILTGAGRGRIETQCLYPLSCVFYYYFDTFRFKLNWAMASFAIGIE
jgi:hypothetical protein